MYMTCYFKLFDYYNNIAPLDKYSLLDLVLPYFISSIPPPALVRGTGYDKINRGYWYINDNSDEPLSPHQIILHNNKIKTSRKRIINDGNKNLIPTGITINNNINFNYNLFVSTHDGVLIGVDCNNTDPIIKLDVPLVGLTTVNNSIYMLTINNKLKIYDHNAVVNTISLNYIPPSGYRPVNIINVYNLYLIVTYLKLVNGVYDLATGYAVLFSINGVFIELIIENGVSVLTDNSNMVYNIIDIPYSSVSLIKSTPVGNPTYPTTNMIIVGITRGGSARYYNIEFFLGGGGGSGNVIFTGLLSPSTYRVGYTGSTSTRFSITGSGVNIATNIPDTPSVDPITRTINGGVGAFGGGGSGGFPVGRLNGADGGTGTICSGAGGSGAIDSFGTAAGGAIIYEAGSGGTSPGDIFSPRREGQQVSQ